MLMGAPAIRACPRGVEWWDGHQWNRVSLPPATPPWVGHWHRWSDTLPDEANRDALRLRFSGWNNINHIDDVFVGCAEPDDDLDGIPAPLDCDDDDADHQRDCGLCVDKDGDGFGTGCDIGPDCDDTDPDRNPGAIEVDGDEIDQDCQPFEATPWFDDFSEGVVNPEMFSSSPFHEPEPDSRSITGWALKKSRHTEPLDTTACTTVGWFARVARGDIRPASPSRTATLSWVTAGGSATLLDLPGASILDPQFVHYFGEITDPAALSVDFTVDWDASDDFALDALGVGCNPIDADNDGVPAGPDCNDADARHQFDCVTCVDRDGDGYGTGCDLGGDCADHDAAVFPNQTDLAGDGVGQRLLRRGWARPSPRLYRR